MKITIVEVEATPAEIEATPSVVEALSRLGATSQPTGQEPPRADTYTGPPVVNSTALSQELPDGGDLSWLPDEGVTAVRALLGRNPAPRAWAAFMAVAAALPNVGVYGVKRRGHESGQPLDYTDYLRLRKRGSSVGGFAYTWPAEGRVNFRLRYPDGDALRAIAPSAWTTTTGHRQYRVSADIRDTNVDEIISLARIAYERT